MKTGRLGVRGGFKFKGGGGSRGIGCEGGRPPWGSVKGRGPRWDSDARLSVCRGKVPAGRSCGSEEAQGLPQLAASTQLLPIALAAVPKGHCLSP